MMELAYAYGWLRENAAWAADMLEHLGHPEEAGRLREAITESMARGEAYAAAIVEQDTALGASE